MISLFHPDSFYQFRRNPFARSSVPIILTGIICLILAGMIRGEIFLMNRFIPEDILLKIRLQDVLIGITIYLKTSVDFAIFIGNLMAQFRGVKNRIMIEIGTALGNALGTMMILGIWNLFKEIDWLLSLMILWAALVLFQLAEDGLEHFLENQSGFPQNIRKIVGIYALILDKVNSVTGLILKKVMPNLSMSAPKSLSLTQLIFFSFSIPFILGLDDFAGYVPLFSEVNVFGFALGVIVGHMVLNIFLFISPTKTIKLVKNPLIALLGSFAFVLLGIWGLWEVGKMYLIGH